MNFRKRVHVLAPVLETYYIDITFITVGAAFGDAKMTNAEKPEKFNVSNQ